MWFFNWGKNGQILHTSVDTAHRQDSAEHTVIVLLLKTEILNLCWVFQLGEKPQKFEIFRFKKSFKFWKI